MVVKSGGRIKLAFLMSSWHGISRTKCIRCFKPYKQGTVVVGFKKCLSCGLEVLKVHPEAIAFETTDIQIGLGPDTYRDYRLSKRIKSPEAQTHHPTSNTSTAATESVSPTPPNTRPNTRSDDNPPIDLVCKRLIVKWEPIYNIVHRYLHCRCILRLTTPSRVEKEQTILVLAGCPRHNTKNLFHRDYGDLEYDKDPYFDQFGGYRAFQGFVYLYQPHIYRMLGCEKFVPTKNLDAATKAVKEIMMRGFEGLTDPFLEYFLGVNDAVKKAGVQLPEPEAEIVEIGRQRRKEERIASHKALGIESMLTPSEDQQRMISESPMMQQVRDILDGKWNGKKHWEWEDDDD
ncbi:hypothetical protein ONS96_002723 [Cadophora gregata f. sp. sojae]|nr:hypothetical protein ONS96_002723 [Cadophora gregata f. sp. sojae]